MIVTDGSTESVRGSSLAMQKYVSTLHVVRAHSYDNGTYVCIATNFWDSYFAEASINVIGELKYPVKVNKVLIMLGSLPVLTILLLQHKFENVDYFNVS